MAETINIKLLIDAAESAKTVAETRKALKDLRSAALQVEEGSTAFQQINQAAGQLQDKIGDLQATTKYFSNDMRNLEGLTSIATGIAGGFSLAQGAAQLFGSENEKLNESMVKLQAVMAVLNGLQAIGLVLQKESAASLFIQNNTRKLAIALTSEQAVAEAAEAVAAGTATVAQRALNAAMSANPIGLLITLIAAATTALMAFSGGSKEAEKEEKKRADAIRKSNEEYKKMTETLGKESGQFVGLIEQLRSTNFESERRRDLIKEINDTYGLTLKNIEDETAFTAQLNNAVNDYIELQYNRFIMTKNQGYIDDQMEKKYDARIKKQQALREAQELVDSGIRKSVGDALSYREDLRKTIAQADKDIAESDAALAKLGAYREQLVNQQNKLTDYGKKYEVQTKKNTDATKKNTDATDENTEAVDRNAEAIEIITDQESFLTELRLDNEQRATDLLGESLNKRLSLLKIDYERQQKENEDNFKNQIANTEEFFKSLEKNDILSAENKKKLEEEKTKLIEEQEKQKKKITEFYEAETTKLVQEEQEKRIAAAREAASAVLNQEQYFVFFNFLTSQIHKLDDIMETSQLQQLFGGTRFKASNAVKELDKFTDAFIDNVDKLFIEGGGKVRQLMEDTFELQNEATRNGTRGLVEILQKNKKAFSEALDDYSKQILKAGVKDTLEQIFLLNDDNRVEYTLKLTAFYQDKFDIIKQGEDEINKLLKETGATFSFSVLPTGDTEKGLGDIDASLSQKLTDTLTKRYNQLKEAETKFYNESLFNLQGNYENKNISAAEYNRQFEELQKKHTDNLLNIDIVYGQASQEDLANRVKEKNAERIALEKKVVDELLALETQLQNGILDLFQRRLDAQNRAAQQRYDDEIARIDAEEQAYNDSIDNRTAAEQAQLDTQMGFDEQRKNASDKLAIEQDALKQKEFNAQKANDAIQVAIQTAVAVATTIAELGGIGAITPAGIALIAAVVAQGAIAEALILSQQYVPAFSKGGLVQGPGSGTSDSIPARLSNGESVINARSTRMFAPLLSAINEAGGGRAIPHMALGGMVGVPAQSTSQSVDLFEKLEKAIYSISDRPIETYVKQTVVTNAQDTAKKIKNRTTFG